ncbi:MAG: thiamine phosphate synthase [Cystobacterineae bacterium]|nr:thiamine phosphate synthase [Cystobacterineae bacterium]
MRLQLLAISPGPLDEAWLCKFEQLLPLGDKLGLLFRDTTSHARSYFEQAQQLAKRCRSAQVAFFIHRRLDMALALDAHLHLPSYGLAPSQVRPHLPPHLCISVSVHNDEEAKKAHKANFALVSPVFPPGSKTEKTRTPHTQPPPTHTPHIHPLHIHPPGGEQPPSTSPPAYATLGPAGFLRLAQQLPCPAWALGGIHLEHLQALQRYLKHPPPLAGIAVVSALWKAAKPFEVAQALLACL